MTASLQDDRTGWSTCPHSDERCSNSRIGRAHAARGTAHDPQRVEEPTRAMGPCTTACHTQSTRHTVGSANATDGGTRGLTTAGSWSAAGRLQPPDVARRVTDGEDPAVVGQEGRTALLRGALTSQPPSPILPQPSAFPPQPARLSGRQSGSTSQRTHLRHDTPWAYQSAAARSRR